MKYPPLHSGIYELMRDLGEGLNDPDTLMLGGGNPSILEATRDFFNPLLQKMTKRADFFRRSFQSYSHPQGEGTFIHAIRDYFLRKTNWALEPEQICITQGSQQGFYMLFNYLVGKFHAGENSPKPVLLAVKTPDYIGYFDLIPRDHFLSVEGKLMTYEDGTFSYSIDFAALERILNEEGKEYEVKAMVISTPNNPSSHVLSQSDADYLCHLSEKYDKLIIFDHAYGFPFPNIIFGENTVYPLTPHTLHCFSFSKTGLPGLRTGIMIGDPSLIEKMILMNGIVNLSPSSLTCAFLEEVFHSSDFDRYIRESLYPHYVAKKETAFSFLKEQLRGTPAMLHRPQGGFFLWLGAPHFPLSSYHLYQEIKERKTVVVPGNYFFLREPPDAYLRISYTMEEKRVLQGLEIIGDTIRKYYNRGSEKKGTP